MDADHDGKVTAAEMDAAQKAMPTSSSESPNKMTSADKIKVVDSNRDGILSADEHEAGSRRMFEKMDKDRDGTLTAAEISAGHKTMMKKTN
jgi:Ca2+-binding EF-hand superfamily protein